ncbi:hypothetical protein [Aurantimonas sp. 22II-16-19i]|uniref:hypothetical protein n=1 Tax=Aurantimonas sp. 22II-16-19i TaxID=1317114 RepID=UPI0009F7F55D|nr:hypothetical protein [Aurantimonas sp. 22II-16-19i]ORE87825.1 hypothetical protein ATO4_25078 [Aurantimonas sp. 22II-16-19i]
MARESLNARRSRAEPVTAEMEVMFIHIDHDALEKPIRLSTDPTDFITEDPLVFGTHSPWLQPEEGPAEPYLFMIADALMPRDKRGAVTELQLALLAVDQGIVELLLAIPPGTRARASLAVALLSDPGRLISEFRRLELSVATGNRTEIPLTLTGPDISAVPWPAGRQTKARFPGLFR